MDSRPKRHASVRTRHGIDRLELSERFFTLGLTQVCVLQCPLLLHDLPDSLLQISPGRLPREPSFQKNSLICLAEIISSSLTVTWRCSCFFVVWL